MVKCDWRLWKETWKPFRTFSLTFLHINSFSSVIMSRSEVLQPIVSTLNQMRKEKVSDFNLIWVHKICKSYWDRRQRRKSERANNLFSQVWLENLNFWHPAECKENIFSRHVCKVTDNSWWASAISFLFLFVFNFFLSLWMLNSPWRASNYWHNGMSHF